MNAEISEVTKKIHDDYEWQYVLNLLPPDYEESARETGAFLRPRGVRSPADLLRTLLLHLCGESMRVTSAIAEHSGFGNISDVAILKRLRNAGPWFSRMTRQLMGMREKRFGVSDRFRVRLVDATSVTESGKNGSEWLVHYSYDLDDFACDEAVVTKKADRGESVTNFAVRENDLIVGDRAYGSITGIRHVEDAGGRYVFRVRSGAFALYDERERRFSFSVALSKIRGVVGEFEAYVFKDGYYTKTRICAVRKDPAETARTLERIRKEAKKRGRTPKKETLAMAGFVIVATNLSAEEATAAEILELYRLRWQVEIAFKRLKGIFGLGQLPKYSPKSAKAWIEGKLFLSVLTEAILDEGRLFSPWGYRLRRGEPTEPEPMATNETRLHPLQGNPDRKNRPGTSQ